MIYLFKPKADITAFELAKILILMTQDAIETDRPVNAELLRHFKGYKTSKEFRADIPDDLEKRSNENK